jgi:SAM-dependent methyltransferase
MLKLYFPFARQWVDLGCGTGLGKTLIPGGEYVGADIDSSMVRACKAKNPGTKFICCDAGNVMSVPGVKLALFSADDFPYGTMVKLAMQEKAFVVIYNKPWLSGSASFWAGKRARYMLRYGVRSILLKIALKMGGYIMFPLLGQPYYIVGVKNGRKVSKGLRQCGALEVCQNLCQNGSA